MRQTPYLNVLLSAASLILLFSLISLSVEAQSKTKIVVPLQIKMPVEQGFCISSLKLKPFDKNSGASNLERIRFVGTLMEIQALGDQGDRYRIKIDANGDDDLSDEIAHVLQPDSPIEVKLKRKWKGNREATFAYLLRYVRSVNGAQQVARSLGWTPNYRAEGIAKINGSEMLVAVLDANADGAFDTEDFRQATSIGLDRNLDGKIWGKGEYVKGTEIIEFGQASLLIDDLAPDGSAITFIETELRVPKIGEPLPQLSFTTLQGEKVNSADFIGQPFILDFWASWCQPCVKGFVHLKELEKEYQGKIKIISVNVDEPSRLAMARQIIKEYQLTMPQVMNGLGESDPIWKIFGGIGDNQMVIPLYVVADSTGQLRYAGFGGAELLELRQKIKELMKSR